VTSNVKHFLVLDFGLSPMADVFGQGRPDSVNIGSGKLLRVDDYQENSYKELSA
jgi:hypothetical protein